MALLCRLSITDFLSQTRNCARTQASDSWVDFAPCDRTQRSPVARTSPRRGTKSLGSMLCKDQKAELRKEAPNDEDTKGMYICRKTWRGYRHSGSKLTGHRINSVSMRRWTGSALTTRSADKCKSVQSVFPAVNEEVGIGVAGCDGTVSLQAQQKKESSSLVSAKTCSAGSISVMRESLSAKRELSQPAVLVISGHGR